MTNNQTPIPLEEIVQQWKHLVDPIAEQLDLTRTEVLLMLTVNTLMNQSNVAQEYAQRVNKLMESMEEEMKELRDSEDWKGGYNE